MTTAGVHFTKSDVRRHVKKYAQANNLEAAKVMLSSVMLYALAVWSYGRLPVAMWLFFRAFVSVRMFMVFHDCTHNAFVTSRWGNEVLGWISGLFVATPFVRWRDNHLFHHRVLGNVDLFDDSRTVYFSTQEYRSFPLWKRALWRVVRDPFVYFVLAPSYLWLYRYRTVKEGFPGTVYLSAALMYMYTTHGVAGVWWELVAIVLASALGVILFHWQHQVNLGYRTDSKGHSVVEAGLHGSTFLLVPWYLRWVTLGIEYHHIHHLATHVPCYALHKCHEEAPQHFWANVTRVDWRKAVGGFFNVMYNAETELFEPFPSYQRVLRVLGLEDLPEDLDMIKRREVFSKVAGRG